MFSVDENDVNQVRQFFAGRISRETEGTHIGTDYLQPGELKDTGGFLVSYCPPNRKDTDLDGQLPYERLLENLESSFPGLSVEPQQMDDEKRLGFFIEVTPKALLAKIQRQAPDSSKGPAPRSAHR